jgi:hypothetical protein
LATGRPAGWAGDGDADEDDDDAEGVVVEAAVCGGVFGGCAKVRPSGC